MPRSEVAAAATRRPSRSSAGSPRTRSTSARVDVYDPARNAWGRLADLPVETNHAMAAGSAGRIFVFGGYAGDGHRRRDAFVYANGPGSASRRCRSSARPAARPCIGGKLYVAGGTTGLPGVGDARRLASAMLVYDPNKRRWSQLPGPTPREHLGVAALGGKLYVAGGPRGRLRHEPPPPRGVRPRDAAAGGAWRRFRCARGGTGLAAVAGRLVSAGGEEPAGSIASVYRLHARRRTAGRGSPTCPRRATAWASSASAAAST